MTSEGGKEIKRCAWAQNDPQMREYHDHEWGVPEFDSRTLWELLMLEGFQAGLSWIVVLRKREAFRQAFAYFDPAAVARFGAVDVERLLTDAGIIRSKAKIEATIRGAQIFLEMRESGTEFGRWAWELTGGKPFVNKGEGPTQTPLSEKISKELKQRGFKFVGPVIVYAWMQAAGMVDDHAVDCFLRKANADGKPSQGMSEKKEARSYPVTPDGRYFVVRGRLWRCSDPSLSPDVRKELVTELMNARRAKGKAMRSDDRVAREAARQAVDIAKQRLGERGPVWWTDGAPDLNRKMVKNTSYAAWFAGLNE